MPGTSADWQIPAHRRLLSRVRPKENGCWEWTGYVTADGYGACGYNGRRNTLAHRAVYRELVGHIEDELTLDHLCHTRDLACEGGRTCQHRRCVNPAHLEPVARAENLDRSHRINANREACRRGHAFSEDNTGTYRNRRICKTCDRIRGAAYRARLREVTK